MQFLLICVRVYSANFAPDCPHQSLCVLLWFDCFYASAWHGSVCDVTEMNEVGIQRLHCSISTLPWSWSHLHCPVSWKVSSFYMAFCRNAHGTASTFIRG